MKGLYGTHKRHVDHMMISNSSLRYKPIDGTYIYIYIYIQKIAYCAPITCTADELVIKFIHQGPYRNIKRPG